MKSNIIFAMIMITTIMITACKQTEQKVEVVEIDLLNDEFSEAQKAVSMTLDSIVQSVKDGDLDRLIAFHAYGPKFTEFKNGEVRNGDKENEDFERGVFGSVTEISKFDFNDTKIAVYGDIANVTTHTDFHLKFGEEMAVINDQMTLLFLNTDDGWRIIHEHHSPMNSTEE
ncbi:MAG: nuclear transport factor 2 family protein [Croceitalea sp.]|nr:nuclear transport factor 2 family protein [Croceitalea sp.]